MCIRGLGVSPTQSVEMHVCLFGQIGRIYAIPQVLSAATL